MRLIALLFAGLAAGGAFMAMPDLGAAETNREITRACTEFRLIRPSAECPPRVRETWQTDWLLIAAILLVGAAAIAAIPKRRHD